MSELKLIDAIENFPINTAPEVIASKINIVGNLELSSDEIECFNMALILISIQLQNESVDISSLHSVTIMFLSDGNFSVQNMTNDFAGVTGSFIIYVMNILRRWNSAYKIVAIYLEELTHHFWNITDEIEVKHKVLKIMQNVMPELKMRDIYDNGDEYLLS